jgi:hypothetical protein
MTPPEHELDAVALSALRDQLDTFWRRTLGGFGDLVSRRTDDPPEEQP